MGPSKFFYFFIPIISFVIADQFHQSFNNAFSGFNVLNGIKSMTVICPTNTNLTYTIFGGPSFFNYATVISETFSTQVTNGAFYQMNISAKVFHQDFTLPIQNVYFLIMVNNFTVGNISLVNPGPDDICNNMSMSFISRTINSSYILNTYNLSTFVLSFQISIPPGPPSFMTPWGFGSLQIDLFECDTNSCASCYGLPRNCTTFCNIRCQGTGPTNSDCSSCVANTYVNVNGVCLPCDSNCDTCIYNTTNCQSCNITSLYQYLSNNICVQTCPSHQYGSAGVCNVCPEQCGECTYTGTATFCLGCNTSGVIPYYEELITNGYSLCITADVCSQSIGFYPDSNSTCSKCSASCLTCQNTSTNCTACASGYFSNSLPGRCQSSCPFGYYNDTTQMTCVPCQAYCASCSDGTNANCSSCNPSYFLYNTTCNSTCPVSTVPDSSQLACIICKFPCQTCSGQPDTCQSCQTNYTLLSSVCLAYCPLGYYQTQKQVCQPCYGDCLTCTGPIENNCTSCNTTFLNPSTNECLSICPNKTVGINKTCQNCYYNCFNCLDVLDNNCTTCISSYFKQPNNGSCLSGCDPGYYGDVSFWECLTCDSECLTCNGPTNADCLSCKNAFLFINETCISSCPDQYYANYDSYNFKCSNCYIGCLTCINASQNACESCMFGYYFYENTCVADCPKDMAVYNDNNTQSCQSCSAGCLDCLSGAATQCLSCKTGSYFYQNSCISICLDGFFPNQILLWCENCSTECQTCFGPNIDECYACPMETFLLNNSCMAQCPDGYFGNQSTQTCDLCAGVCQLCTNSANNCSLCVSSYYLNNNNTCLSTCPDGKYKSTVTLTNGTCQNCSTSCFTCLNYSQCLSCPNFSYLLGTNCLDSCPNFYWSSDLNNECQACDSSCKQCQNSSNNTCSSCAPYYYLFNWTCLPNCPTHYYKNETAQQCFICDDACDLCFNATANSCTNCSVNYYFKNAICVNYCGNGYFPDITTKTCLSCTPECAQCTGPLITTCQLCASSYFLLNTACYKQCPSGYCNDNSNQICAKCDPTCKTCFGKSEFNCTSCFLSTFLYFYQCLSQCPNGFYPNDNDQTCDPCYMSCATCTGPFNNGSCLTCNSKLVLNDGTCQPSGTCPLNKWQNGSVCTLCNQTCKSCLGAGGQNCSSCNNETYLLSGQCLTQCPPALVAVSDVWKCLKICDYTCSDCFGPKDDQCNLCPSTRFLVQSDSNSINSSSVCTCNSRFFSQDPGLKNATCLACDASCNECQGPTPYNCTQCPYNKDLINGQCQCLIGLYLNGVNCERCSPYCYTCSGSPNNCTECLKNQHVNENNSCECDIGYYQDDIVCYACQYTCNKCTGPDAEDCIPNQCAGNHIYNDGYCTCPFWSEDFGKNATCTNKTSLNCDQTCNVSQCYGPDSDNCYSCKADRYLKNNTCLCNDGTYDDGVDETCQKCDPSCKICNGPLFSDCIEECISTTRGSNGIPTNGICDCSPGNIDTLEPDCPATPFLLKTFSSTFAVTLYVNTPSMAIIAVSQTTIVVTKFIETCQLFSYLSYLNLQYPLDTKNYFDMLNYFNVDPIFVSSDTVNGNNNSNVTNSSNSSNTNQTNNNEKTRILQEDNKFDRIKYGNEEFLENAWILLTINGGIFIFSAIYSSIYHFFHRQKVSILTKIRNIIRWNLPIRVFSITSLQLFFYIALKFHQSSAWNSTDSIISIIILIILVYFMIYFIIVINLNHGDIDAETYYGALWDGVNTFFFIKRNYFIFNIIRKALVVAFITSVTLDSFTQILGCMITCLIFLAYIILARPFISNLEWVFTIIMEICYCVLLIVIFTYNNLSIEDAAEKIKFGYAIIISLSVFMLATFIFAMIHIVKFIRKVYSIFVKKNENNLITRQTTINSSFNNNSAFTAKIGKAYEEYSKEVDKQKNVVVVYNKKEEQKKKKNEEEKMQQKEMKNKLKDIEEEKRSRMGLQSIFEKQKAKTLKKKDSFQEEDPQENNRENKNFEDVMKNNAMEKNSGNEHQDEKNSKTFRSFLTKEKTKQSEKKRDSFEEDNWEEDIEDNKKDRNLKEINVEMGNFEDF